MVSRNMPRELPKTYTYCNECWRVMDYCKCGEPRCENDCGKYATKKVKFEDDTYWFCGECKHEGEEVA